MSAGYCSGCGARVTGRYCSHCGTAVSGAPGGPRRRAIWTAAGFAILSVIALVVIAVRQPEVPPARPEDAAAITGSGGDTPPDISGLSARQRFDTLYNVVMRASENGDAARATRFAPMALMAYAQLEQVDADARYHAAVLRMHVEGDIKPALLLADTIQTTDPQHLFTFMIRGMAGQLAGDKPMIRKAALDFLSVWDAEIASGKPEYQDHRIMLDQFRERAQQSRATAKP